MEEFNNISEIISQSVKDSSYITVIISSVVFILYTVVVRLIDLFKSKAKDKPLYEMGKAMKEMADNLVKLNSVLDKTLEDNKRKQFRQSECAIDLGFKAFGYRVISYATNVIINNNIDTNKDFVHDNIHKTISNGYYVLHSKLAAYEVNEVIVSTKLTEDIIQKVTDEILDIIYNKETVTTRITQVNNKMNLFVQEFSAKTINKILNT